MTDAKINLADLRAEATSRIRYPIIRASDLAALIDAVEAAREYQQLLNNISTNSSYDNVEARTYDQLRQTLARFDFGGDL